MAKLVENCVLLTSVITSYVSSSFFSSSASRTTTLYHYFASGWLTRCQSICPFVTSCHFLFVAFAATVFQDTTRCVVRSVFHFTQKYPPCLDNTIIIIITTYYYYQPTTLQLYSVSYIHIYIFICTFLNTRCRAFASPKSSSPRPSAHNLARVLCVARGCRSCLCVCVCLC